MAIEVTEGQRLNIDWFTDVLNRSNKNPIDIIHVTESIFNLDNSHFGFAIQCDNPTIITTNFTPSEGFFCYVNNKSNGLVTIQSEESIVLLPNEFTLLLFDSTKFISFELKNFQNLTPIIEVREDIILDLTYNGQCLNVKQPCIITVVNIGNINGFSVDIQNSSKGDVLIIGEDENCKINGEESIVLKSNTSTHLVCDHSEYRALFIADLSECIKKSNIKEITSDVLPSISYGDILLVKSALTLVLPVQKGLAFYIKRIFDSGNLILNVANNGTIEGETTLELDNFDTAHLYCDGTNYYLL